MSEEFAGLIDAAKRGDQTALSRLYNEYLTDVLPVVRRRLRGSLRREFDTLDIGHSVFIEVLRDLPRFEVRGEPAFRRWLSIKVENLIHTKFRKRLRKGLRREVTIQTGIAPGEFSGEPGPLSHTIRDEEDTRLYASLEMLDEHYRRALLLRDEESLSFAEIAAWMNLPSPDAARKLYARALLRLRLLWNQN
jgi:RNA polymerase sigma factor (sigma-70 family)